MTEQEKHPAIPQSVIIPRSEHAVSRASISDNALKVLYRLKNADYQAYLVGGGVRDLSLGREPKDFDIATDASPEEVRALFRNCRLIGRRFRLAHVHFGPEIIEVATFRALHDGESSDDGDVQVEENGRILRDNVYGTVEEDALRRDFTINSLYYNIADFSIVDFANGMPDLREGVLRLIGDPESRYREDAVRMLRAIRFAAKLGFIIDSDTARPIPDMAPLLENIPQARLFEEVLKLFMSGHGLPTFELLRRYGLFSQLFPETDAVLETDGYATWVRFIALALENTDRRVSEGKPVTPAFLFAALLWPAVVKRSAEYEKNAGMNQVQALQEAINGVAERQLRRVALPKRFGIPMREIFLLQPRLLRYGGKRAQRLLSHPRFRAAYDFLLLRAAVGEVEQELVDVWTQLQESGEGQAAQALALANERPPAQRRRRRRPPGSGGGSRGAE